MAEPRIYHVDVFEDYPATFLARMEDLADGELVTQDSLASITYKIFDIAGPQPDRILSQGNLVIADVVSDHLKLDHRWTQDNIGFNFVHTLPGTAFPTGITTLFLEYAFTPTGGTAPSFGLFFVIHVIRTRFTGAIPASGTEAGQGPFGESSAGGSQ
jgi:hypothetical protein